MKIFIIILFFILIFILSINIKLDIEKIEILNRKVKFSIYVKIYLFRKILIFKKKIKKREIIKLIPLFQRRKIIKDERILKRISIKVEKIDLTVVYNLKDPVCMAYIYGILQALTNIFASMIQVEKRNIDIRNQYKGKTYMQIRSEININLGRTIIKNLVNKREKIKEA